MSAFARRAAAAAVALTLGACATLEPQLPQAQPGVPAQFPATAATPAGTTGGATSASGSHRTAAAPRSSAPARCASPWLVRPRQAMKAPPRATVRLSCDRSVTATSGAATSKPSSSCARVVR